VPENARPQDLENDDGPNRMVGKCRTTSHMGNSPSVSGPERGRAHVKRDITKDDHSAEPRPANHNACDSDIELAEELTK